VVLKPVHAYPDPTTLNGWLIVAERMNVNGTPHRDDARSPIDEEAIADGLVRLRARVRAQERLQPSERLAERWVPGAPGPPYCAVGYQYVAGREMIDAHLEIFLQASLGITGVNADVMLGQQECPCLGHRVNARDDLNVSRYPLFQITERHKVRLELHQKPRQGDWIGSGMHTNFSYPYLHNIGGEQSLTELLERHGIYLEAHLSKHRALTDERLTGRHEPAASESITYGVSDRSTSVTIPVFTVQHGQKRYLEGRQPASNADPCRMVSRIVKTIDQTHKEIL
jgi:glutamine synthetase